MSLCFAQPFAHSNALRLPFFAPSAMFSSASCLFDRVAVPADPSDTSSAGAAVVEPIGASSSAVAAEAAAAAPSFFDQFLPRETGVESGPLLGDEAAQFITRHRYLGVTYARCDVPLEFVLEHIGDAFGCGGTARGGGAPPGWLSARPRAGPAESPSFPRLLRNGSSSTTRAVSFGARSETWQRSSTNTIGITTFRKKESRRSGDVIVPLYSTPIMTSSPLRGSGEFRVRVSSGYRREVP